MTGNCIVREFLHDDREIANDGWQGLARKKLNLSDGNCAVRNEVSNREMARIAGTTQVF
jgi:hypothetical protein